jgi:hypothetical protein
MKNILLSSLVIIATLAACNRPNIGIRNQTLSKHSWKLTEQQENGVEIPLRPCDMDNEYYFYGTFNGTMFEGPQTCDSATVVSGDGSVTTVPVQEIDFTWSVTGDQRYILIKGFGNPDYNPEWQILDMSDQSFHVKGIDHRNGATITYYKTFEAVKNL